MNVVLYAIYSVLIFSVLMMISCANPIHSVVFFIMVFLCSAMIFIFLHADFIGLVFLMVYVGAIAVLFIFVVMMLNVKKLERDHTTYFFIGGFIIALFSMQLIYICIHAYGVTATSNVLFNNALLYDYLTNADEFSTKYMVQLLGIALFGKYSALLLFSGVTLLVALLGSVYLTNTKTGYSVRRQDNQLNRNNRLYNLHIY